MKKIRISIIIPIYNAERFLKACVDSVVGQVLSDDRQHIDYEVLLIDDGSTDASGSICDMYSSENANVLVFHNTNMGVSASRNFGIMKSSGDYLLFVDADDIVSDKCLANLTNPLQDYDYDMIVGQYIQNDGVTCETLIQGEIKGNANIKEAYSCGSWYLMPWNKLVRKEFIEKNNLYFPMQFALHEDYIWSFCISCCAENLYIIDEETYTYRLNEESVMSRTTIEADFVAYVEAFLYMKEYAIRRGETMDRWVYSMIEGKKSGVVYSLFQVDEKELFNKHYKELVKSSYISPLKAYIKGIITLPYLIRDFNYLLPNKLGAIYKYMFYLLVYKLRNKKIDGAVWK